MRIASRLMLLMTALLCVGIASAQSIKWQTDYNKAAQLAKGSATPGREKVATVTRKQCEEIAKIKMADLGAASLAAAVRMIEGTARSSGIAVEG